MEQAEAERLAALHEYRLLDAPADAELEAVVRVAAVVAGVPTATLNLIDEARQHQLTTVGFEGQDSPREHSMCALRFREGATVHVADASRHPDYADNPWVTGRLAAVRSYTSVPLVTPSGHALGSLCVFDGIPLELDDEQLARLEDLAQVVIGLFERRRQARRNAELAAEADEQRLLSELTMHELEARQELTSAVLDTIDVAVVAAGPDGRLTLFNRTAQDWHGLPADSSVDRGDLAGRYALYEADGTTVMPAERIPLVRALVEGSVSGAELVIAPQGREPVRVVAAGRALQRADGTPLGAVVAMTDVTAERARRAELEAAHAELERSNTELEHFAAVASHDLRSPLTVIDGYLDLLDDLHGDDLPAQARGWIATARRGVTRMQGLIESLLSYAQAGGGAGAVRTTVAAGEVLEQAVVDLRADLRVAGCTVSVPRRLPEVSCDPTLLRQLLQNLLSNAVRYRSPERPCEITVTAEVAAGEVRFAVADTGLGVPADQRERVFAMFATADAGERGGHGIGLATCQRIVALHGGRIWIEDTAGGGATVRFTIAAPGATAPEPAVAGSAVTT